MLKLKYTSQVASFVVDAQPTKESTTVLTTYFQLADAIPPAPNSDEKKGRLGSRGKACMHRRNTQQGHTAYGSFKRRSIKLRQKDNNVDECKFDF